VRVALYSLPQGSSGLLVPPLLLQEDGLLLEGVGVEGVQANRHPRRLYRTLHVPRGSQPPLFLEVVLR
jgi:hypothetical protein